MQTKTIMTKFFEGFSAEEAEFFKTNINKMLLMSMQSKVQAYMNRRIIPFDFNAFAALAYDSGKFLLRLHSFLRNSPFIGDFIECPYCRKQDSDVNMYARNGSPCDHHMCQGCLTKLNIALPYCCLCSPAVTGRGGEVFDVPNMLLRFQQAYYLYVKGGNPRSYRGVGSDFNHSITPAEDLTLQMTTYSTTGRSLSRECYYD
jgi:hypothetical protein